MIIIIVILIIIILLWWIYDRQYSTINCKKTNFIDIDFKTGDVIYMKANNNYNSIFHGCYFGHIGIVVIVNGEVMIFEAADKNILFDPKKPIGPDNTLNNGGGIYLTNLYDRIKNYPGTCYCRQFKNKIDQELIYGFNQFIDYAKKYLKYYHSIFYNGIKLYLGVRKCNRSTNCAELVFLSWIKLGLIPIDEYEKNICHILYYVCNKDKFINNELGEMKQIIY